MRIALLEPYYTGSHRAWADGYAQNSSHQVDVLSLPGQYWRWRMQGGAVTLAREYRGRGMRADLILSTDMLDLPLFLSLSRDLTANVPTAVYFHENQLTYPILPGERRELYYGFVNYASALAADRVFFNSRYHLDSFLDELPRLLKHYPDFNELDSVEAIRTKADVLPLGLDLAAQDACRPVATGSAPPAILWNQRWEYDKNPGEFLVALSELDAMGLPFSVILLGESIQHGMPAEFLEARRRLGERVLHFGFEPDRSAYSRLLWQADVVVSTAHHEFFGAAVAEAIYCGCYPVLPARLAYPELLPERLRRRCLYPDHHGLLNRLAGFLQGARPSPDDTASLRQHCAGFDWSQMAPIYDGRFAALVEERPEARSS